MNQPTFGTPDPNIEISMLRGMVDDLSSQVSDLSRFLIAVLQTTGGNIELPAHVVESLDAKDTVNIEPVVESRSIRVWVTRQD